MERIKVILDHIIDSAKIEKNEDLEICTRILLASIEKNCLNDFAEACLKFTEEKVIERMMNEN